MVDIFEEVDEELRRDKYQDLLRQWGPWALGAALAVIAGSVAWQSFAAWQTGGRQTASDAFIAAMTHSESGELALAAASLETLAEDGTPGYVSLALIQRGNVAIEQGDSAAAAGFFEQAAARSSDPVLRDMAEIRAVWASWDSLSLSDVDLRLSPLVNADSPYRHIARETIAAAALRAEDIERARTHYQFLAFSSDAPAGVQSRAQEAMALIAQRTALAEPTTEDVTTNDAEAGADLSAPVDGADEPAAEEEATDAGDAGDD